MRSAYCRASLARRWSSSSKRTMRSGLGPGGRGRSFARGILALQARAADRYDPQWQADRQSRPVVERPDARFESELSASTMMTWPMIRECGRTIRSRDADFPATHPQRSLPTCSCAPRARGSRRAQPVDVAAIVGHRRYYQELKSGPQDRQSRAWLSECLQSANWLLKALDQRAPDSDMRQGRVRVVKRQQGFFERGVSAMKPMTLREVAEAIGMHKSTVSRVTSNKYLLCDSAGSSSSNNFSDPAFSQPQATALPRRSEGGDQAGERRRGGDPQRRRDRRAAEKRGALTPRGERSLNIASSMGIGSSIQRRRLRKIAG